MITQPLAVGVSRLEKNGWYKRLHEASYLPSAAVRLGPQQFTTFKLPVIFCFNISFA